MEKKKTKMLLKSKEDKHAAVIVELKQRKPGGPIIQWEDITKKRRPEGHSFIDDIIRSKRRQFRIIKAALGFPIGLMFGAGLYFGVIQFMDLNEFVLHFMGLILGISIAIGYSISIQVRCICWLILPTLFGKSGRTYLGTIAITEVINGPYETLVCNSKDSVRVIGCIMGLSINHSVERFKLMIYPLKEVTKEFVKSKNIAQTEAISMMDTFNPVEEEIRDENEINDIKLESDDLDRKIKMKSRSQGIEKRFKKMQKSRQFGKNTENLYRKKQEYRCEDIFTKAVKRCRDAHTDAYRICLSKLPLVGYLICWAVKLDFLCEMAKPEDTCYSKNAVDDGLGESVDMMSLVKEQVHKEFHVSLYYKLRLPEVKVDQIVAEDLTESLLNQFESRRRIGNMILTLMKRILAFLFLHTFLAAKSYNKSYLRDIEHDNLYITSYFCHIDKRRKRMRKFSLLPLKKVEKRKFIYPLRLKKSKQEKTKFVVGTLMLLPQVILATFIILVDRLFYEFLMILQRSAKIELHQKGQHIIELKIEGTGFVANIIRSIIKSFKFSHTLDKVTNTLVCLPKPVALEYAKLLKIYGIYGIIWILIMTQAYGLRLRRIISSIFYPKREKKRVLFLYNNLLKKRKTFISDTQSMLRDSVREGFLVDKPFLQILRFGYPKWFSWLKYLKLGRRSCIICREKETKFFQLCRQHCGAGYCRQCWREVNRECYACNVGEDTASEADVGGR